MGDDQHGLDYLAHVRADGEALIAALEAAPDAPVAACPGWDLTELARHTAGIHRWVTEMVSTGMLTRLSRQDMPEQPPSDPAELAPWARRALDDLLAALERAGTDTPVWTFGSEQASGFWHRRQAHETSVHRWDAQAAAAPTTGIPPADIDPALAADGMDEVIDNFLARFTPPVRLHLHAPDVERTWHVAGTSTGAGTGAADTNTPEVAVTAPAAELLLFLWGRALPKGESAGDEDLLRAWQDAVRL